MDCHERFINFPTMDISILEDINVNFKNESHEISYNLVNIYWNRLHVNPYDERTLKMLKMILCYQYQLIHSKKIELNSLKKNLIPKETKKMIEIIHILKNIQDKEESSLFYDIMVLLNILYMEDQELMDFLKYHKYSDVLDSETSNLYLQILICYLECLYSRNILTNNMTLVNKDEIAQLCVDTVKYWFNTAEERNWRYFTLLLQKMIKVFHHEDWIIAHVSELILTELNELKDCYAALLIFIDIYFPVDTKNFFYFGIFHSNVKFWKLIFDGLSSDIQMFHRQAMALMKRAVCFRQKFQTTKQFPPENLSCEQIEEMFISIFEVLEEKQNHLVMPVLSNLPALYNGYKDHLTCHCINIVWLQCVLKRILKHENTIVIKYGILQSLKMNVDLFNEEFTIVFLNGLNNTFLYECSKTCELPEIAIALIESFSSENMITVMSNIFEKLPHISWGPIAIFYVLKSLATAIEKLSSKLQWLDKKIKIATQLLNKNLNTHPPILQAASQIEILKIICFSIKNIDDYTSLENFLSSFPNKNLNPKTKSWKYVINWFKETISEAKLIKFIHDCVQKYSIETENLSCPSIFALLTLLFHDAKFIFSDKKSYQNCEKILINWLNSINGIDARPYADITVTMNIISFISHLLNVGRDFETILQLLSRYIKTIVNYFVKFTKKIIRTLSNDNVDKFTQTMTLLFSNLHCLVSSIDLVNYANEFFKEGISILEDGDNLEISELTCGLNVIYSCQKIFEVLNIKHLYNDKLLNILVYLISKDSLLNTKKSEGKVISKYYILHSEVMCDYLANASIQEWETKIQILSYTSNVFDKSGNEITSVIAKILYNYVKKKRINELDDDFKSIFLICWKSTFLNRKNNLFWPAIKSLINVIINENYSMIMKNDEFIEECIDQLLEEANNTPALKKLLITSMRNLHSSCMKNFQKALLACIIHGHAPRRDKRIENQTWDFIAKTNLNNHSDLMYPENYNNDLLIRANAITLLYETIITNTEFVESFFYLILEKLQKDENKRYFNESHMHKVKTRLMQTLLILQPILTETHKYKLQEVLCKSILVESNQYNIRLMQEWLLIKNFLSEINSMELWELFEEIIVKRPGCMKSVASITYHIAHLLPCDKKLAFIETSISFIARGCVGQQYNMRLYSQFVLVKLYEIIEKISSTSVMKYKGLYDVAKDSLQQGNLLKNSVKLEEEFYFSVFNPICDYSLQSIYFEILRLSGMEKDEWISPKLFETVGFRQNNAHPLQLFNNNDKLEMCNISLHSIKQNIVENNSLESFCDVQKKMNPWSSTSLLDDIVLGSVRNTTDNEKLSDRGIIIVASLVDKLPNLGGLARTCEIFGVTQLVVGNINITKDKEFQNLSVSAEKWIPIIEVKPNNLLNYSLSMKDKGWSLIGVEQTMRSKNLLHMEFDKKIVLILGNEKDGIPGNLIPLFDLCVELPQVGFTRSLNVHVTGAICIWQYAIQHIFS